MKSQNKKEITKSTLLKSINRSFSAFEKRLGDRIDGIESKMFSKNEFQSFRLETNIHFNNLETDVRSFKDETRENFSQINEKIDDLQDTVMGHDKRIELLENKI